MRTDFPRGRFWKENRKLPQSRRRHTNKNRRTSRSVSTQKHAPKPRRTGQGTKVIAVVIIGALVISGLYLLFARTGGGGEVATASGLKYVDQVVGTGDSPRAGQTVSVHYTGTLENGRKFDSSLDNGKPIDFVIGTGAVIKGWDEGLMSMKVGGKRKLIIPANLGYGSAGRPPSIPPNSTLLFDVELVGIK